MLTSRNEPFVREVAEGIIALYDELEIAWTEGAYIVREGDEISQQFDPTVPVVAACALGAGRVKFCPEKPGRMDGAIEPVSHYFGVSDIACTGIVHGNDGDIRWPTLEVYANARHPDEADEVIKQDYQEYCDGVAIGTLVRQHFNP